MACGVDTRRRSMARRRPTTSAGCGGAIGHLCPDDGWPSLRGGRPKVGVNRRDLLAGAPHGDKLGSKKAGAEGPKRSADRQNQVRYQHRACLGRCGRLFDPVLRDKGTVNDYSGAAALLGSLPKWLLAHRGYDADWFKDTLKAIGLRPATRAGRPAASSSKTTNAVTNATTETRSCGQVRGLVKGSPR